jgi:hypothetical protein
VDLFELRLLGICSRSEGSGSASIDNGLFAMIFAL